MLLVLSPVHDFLDWLNKYANMANWFAALGTWAAAAATLFAVRAALLQDPRARLRIGMDEKTGRLITHVKPIAFPAVNPPPAGWRGSDAQTTYFLLFSVRNEGRGRATGVEVHVTAVEKLEPPKALIRQDKPVPVLRWAHTWWLFTDPGKTMNDRPKGPPVMAVDIPAGHLRLCDLGFVIKQNAETEAIGFMPNTLFLSADADDPHDVQMDYGEWIIRLEVLAGNAKPIKRELYVEIKAGAYESGEDGVVITPMSLWVRFRNLLRTPATPRT